MKKILIGLLAIGCTHLTYAQNFNEETLAKKLKGVDVISKSSNSAYLEDVHSNDLSLKIRELEYMAATYDITKTMAYEPGIPSTYKVVFRDSSSQIIATYNSGGEIIGSSEKFKNVKLPLRLSTAISKKYPGWEFCNDVYSVTYSKDKGVRKMYKVQIKKDGIKTQLNFDLSNKISANYLAGL